jgi:hypothetical protein
MATHSRQGPLFHSGGEMLSVVDSNDKNQNTLEAMADKAHSLWL